MISMTLDVCNYCWELVSSLDNVWTHERNVTGVVSIHFLKRLQHLDKNLFSWNTFSFEVFSLQKKDLIT